LRAARAALNSLLGRGGVGTVAPIGRERSSLFVEALFDGLPGREILRRKVAQLAGEEPPEDVPALGEEA
jgi:hypothetical protein